MQDLSKFGRGPLIAKTSTAMTPEEMELKKSYNQFMRQQSPFMSQGQQRIEGAKLLGETERKRMEMQKRDEAAFERGLQGNKFRGF